MPARRARVDTTPRVRGLLKSALIRRRSRRYNPACAGTTAGCPHCSSRFWIQPRVCGDYPPSRIRSRAGIDTTPRVRGLQSAFDIDILAHRYNPACAGTTQLENEFGINKSIQPRVCGDYFSVIYRHSRKADTTPRVRGLPRNDLRSSVDTRYNPACAGTTSAPRVRKM